jgi:hypothetical protein
LTQAKYQQEIQNLKDGHSIKEKQVLNSHQQQIDLLKI